MSKTVLSGKPGSIGVFDSGYGGLTILKQIRAAMPEYDFMYLGDNARTPYGTRSFQVVYEFTLQCVTKLFEMGCNLVILACNTASAKALRTIQQIDLPRLDASRRVLGIIRPTVESIGELTHSRHVGLLATPGTVKSLSYPLEINKLYPDIVVTGEACPIWVPLVESGESSSDGADFFVKRHIDSLLSKDSKIDTIILGCTHYPLVKDIFQKHLPNARLVCQDELMGQKLVDYLKRHSEIETKLSRTQTRQFFVSQLSPTYTQVAQKLFPNIHLETL